MKRFIYLLIAMAALSGCTSSMPEDTMALGSTGNSTTTTPPTTNPSVVYTQADCNKFDSAGASGRVRAIRNSAGIVNPAGVKVRMNAAPAGFDTSDNYFLEFYVWGVAPNGSYIYANSVDNTTASWHPVRFRLENATTGLVACPPGGPADCYYGWNTGSNSNIGFNRQAIYSVSGTTSASKITDYNIVVTGTDLVYQVLRVVVRNPTTGYYNQVDTLLPVYEANPGIYAESKPAALETLHPMWSQLNAGWTSSQYLSMVSTNQYCF